MPRGSSSDRSVQKSRDSEPVDKQPGLPRWNCDPSSGYHPALQERHSGQYQCGDDGTIPLRHSQHPRLPPDGWAGPAPVASAFRPQCAGCFPVSVNHPDGGTWPQLWRFCCDGRHRFSEQCGYGRHRPTGRHQLWWRLVVRLPTTQHHSSGILNSNFVLTNRSRPFFSKCSRT